MYSLNILDHQIYYDGKKNRDILPQTVFEPEHSPPSSVGPPQIAGASGIETSDTTDPGIRTFSQQPPLPDEQRNATCEIALFAAARTRSFAFSTLQYQYSKGLD